MTVGIKENRPVGKTHFHVLFLERQLFQLFIYGTVNFQACKNICTHGPLAVICEVKYMATSPRTYICLSPHYLLKHLRGKNVSLKILRLM